MGLAALGHWRGPGDLRSLEPSRIDCQKPFFWWRLRHSFQRLWAASGVRFRLGFSHSRVRRTDRCLSKGLGIVFFIFVSGFVRVYFKSFGMSSVFPGCTLTAITGAV